MEAIIRTNNKDAFNSLISFLKTLNFEVETKNEFKKTSASVSSITPMSLEEFYERNQQSQNEIAAGKLIAQRDTKIHFERKSQ